MLARFNWGALALIAFATCIWLLVLFSVASFAPSARGENIPVHPFIGVAQVCVARPTEPTMCATLRSPHDYDTIALCETDMTDRLTRFAEVIHRGHADWDFRARFSCIPDQTQLNT